MVHSFPNYYGYAGPVFDLIPFPLDVLAFMVALDMQAEPTNTSEPMRGTQDSIYEPGNPAIHP